MSVPCATCRREVDHLIALDRRAAVCDLAAHLLKHAEEAAA